MPGARTVGWQAVGWALVLGVAIAILGAGCAPATGPAAATAAGVPSPAPTATPTALWTGVHSQTVSAGDGTTCQVRDDATLACWGAGVSDPPSGTFISVSEHGGSGCAVRIDGTLACWKSDVEADEDEPNAQGQASAVPGGTFVAVDGNLAAGCAIRTNGTLACWGSSVRHPTGPVRKVVVAYASEGSLTACALMADSTISCWHDEYSWIAEPPGGTYLDFDLGEDWPVSAPTARSSVGAIPEDDLSGQLDAPATYWRSLPGRHMAARSRRWSHRLPARRLRSGEPAQRARSLRSYGSNHLWHPTMGRSTAGRRLVWGRRPRVRSDADVQSRRHLSHLGGGC
jgi:hypothetical protein